jgi:hypothetical protein
MVNDKLERHGLSEGTYQHLPGQTWKNHCSLKLKVKVTLCFSLTELHVMKAFWGRGNIDPLIF